jgi:hypothetical protein
MIRNNKAPIRYKIFMISSFLQISYLTSPIHKDFCYSARLTLFILTRVKYQTRLRVPYKTPVNTVLFCLQILQYQASCVDANHFLDGKMVQKGVNFRFSHLCRVKHTDRYRPGSGSHFADNTRIRYNKSPFYQGFNSFKPLL